jgi:pimeloyl-ACP methyl ester carboxylesterase
MEIFASHDGTMLAFHTIGHGPTLICVPGGPGRASSYLGDLGGLALHRTLVLLDTRGTGDSETPTDMSTCRVDRVVDDVEALRLHLGLDRIDLLGHSAGGGVALLYAARFPHRLDHLVLANPSLHAIGLVSDTDAESVIAQRSAEPWFTEALSAYRAMGAAETFAEAQQHRLAFEPLMYGRWDEAARSHAAADTEQRSIAVADMFYGDYQPDTPNLQRCLAELTAPVLVLAGEVDLWPTAAAAQQAARLFRRGQFAAQPGSGHYPWLDDPMTFATAIEAFLH